MVMYPSENDEEGVTVARNDSDVDAICKGRRRPCVEARGDNDQPDEGSASLSFSSQQKKSLGETTEALAFLIACFNKLLSPRL
jgi:hypothetical protein